MQIKNVTRPPGQVPIREVTVERYKQGRHWAVYDRAELVVVTVYRKGCAA